MTDDLMTAARAHSGRSPGPCYFENGQSSPTEYRYQQWPRNVPVSLRPDFHQNEPTPTHGPAAPAHWQRFYSPPTTALHQYRAQPPHSTARYVSVHVTNALS